MKTFKFIPGFLPVKAIGGYKGKINYLIIEYREEQVLVNEFETGLTRVDFVHIFERPQSTVGPSMFGTSYFGTE